MAKRYVFKFPEADPIIDAWLSCQTKNNESFRALVHEAARKFGAVDYYKQIMEKPVRMNNTHDILSEIPGEDFQGNVAVSESREAVKPKPVVIPDVKPADVRDKIPQESPQGISQRKPPQGAQPENQAEIQPANQNAVANQKPETGFEGNGEAVPASVPKQAAQNAEEAPKSPSEAQNRASGGNLQNVHKTPAEVAPERQTDAVGGNNKQVEKRDEQSQFGGDPGAFPFGNAPQSPVQNFPGGILPAAEKAAPEETEENSEGIGAVDDVMSLFND